MYTIRSSCFCSKSISSNFDRTDKFVFVLWEFTWGYWWDLQHTYVVYIYPAQLLESSCNHVLYTFDHRTVTGFQFKRKITIPKSFTSDEDKYFGKYEDLLLHCSHGPVGRVCKSSITYKLYYTHSTTQACARIYIFV